MSRLYVFGLILLMVGCVPSSQTELVFEENNVAGGNTSGGSSGGGSVNVTDRAASLAAFRNTVYPVVNGNTCKSCHNSQTKGQAPIFADTDSEKAFDAITSSGRVNLINPELSRIYLKVKDNAHNCWTSSCANDAAQILAAVQEWARRAPASSDTGVFTGVLQMPADNTAVSAQTEYGTLLLQAEQPSYASEVISGRFFTEQMSSALEGKYLVLAPPESNPHTTAARTLQFNTANFNLCDEFDAADLAPSTRAVRFMQQRVHIPSGAIDASTGKTVQDGFRPFSATLNFNIVRPDKRLEFAKKLYNNDFSEIDTFFVYNGAPGATAKVVGTPLPSAFQGIPINTDAMLSVLPHFAAPSSVYNNMGQMLTGTFKKDDGSTDNLYNLFKDGSYLPSAAILHRNLKRNPHYKSQFLYKRYKDTIASWFYTGSNKKSQGGLTFIFNNGTYNIDMDTYFATDADISLQCPNEPVNPMLPFNATTNPMKNCTSNPNFLKFHVTNQSSDLMTASSATKCFTLNAGQTAIVEVAESNCTAGNDPKFFHLIDLYVYANINNATVFGPRSHVGSVSNSPNSYVDLETYASGTDYTIRNPADSVFDEMDTDVFFSGGSTNVSENDNITNFSNTLHKKLRASRCVDCHGDGDSARAQFAAATPSVALNALNVNGLINFTSPAQSFRPNGMVHNCDAASTDPRYSCNSNDESALREALTNEIVKWKEANAASAISSGAKTFRSLTNNEKLPGRAKYKIKVTQAGNYNVWIKARKTNNPNVNTVYFRILDNNNSAVRYTTGASSNLSGNGCYKWNIDTTNDVWEWSTPGRSSELASIDQKGYLLLDNNKNPLTLPNNRVYFNLPVGDYTIDVLGLSENLKLDAVGINRVADMTPASRLAFQPDRIAIDEKNVSDYKRKILKFDLSNILNLSAGKKAYFEIEVKKDFNGQNFIFRNPRFSTVPRDFNIKVKGIRLYINDKHNFPDATFNDFQGVVGDNSVITYAPLVALTETQNDYIKFKFDSLTVTTEALTPLFPKGTPPAPIEDRRCAEIDYFIKNVKPILRNAKLMLLDELNEYYGEFPGGPRQILRLPQIYNCTTCHTATHPYFKMSNFTNNEEFCREALSRVDFQNFYQSLVIRGINGTGNHPKFVFVEKFITGADSSFKNHDMSNDYVSGYQPLAIPGDGITLAVQAVPGPLMVWSRTDLGISATSWASMSTAERARITYNGRYRKLSPATINLDVVNYPWYLPETHASLIFSEENPLNPDNKLGALDVISPDPSIGYIHANREDRNNPIVYTVDYNDASGNPAVENLGSELIPFKSGTKLYRANAQPAIDRANIDYNSTTPATNSRNDLSMEHEALRDYYRERVVDWIRRENAARIAE